jgi:hypothetical protein
MPTRGSVRFGRAVARDHPGAGLPGPTAVMLLLSVFRDPVDGRF